MQQKAFTLLNKGMNRDLSISKAGESSAYENHNIRILARDHDTLLSVTNERGNKAIVLGANVGFTGELIGWNVLNNHVVLFTHDASSPEGERDRIYRVDYVDDVFYMLGYEENGIFTAKNKPLFVGNLGFDLEHPIESVVYFETEDIQKIYWVDGKNVLRFMNFMEPLDSEGRFPWQDKNGKYDNTYFDSNRVADFGVTAEITKDNSGNTRANGVIQYLLTYYNKHGQETGVVWVSDLVYLSPVNNGGAADGTNSNKVTLEFSNLDTSYTNYRVYAIFRSSLNAQPVAYIVADGEIEKTHTKTVRTALVLVLLGAEDTEDHHSNEENDLDPNDQGDDGQDDEDHDPDTGGGVDNGNGETIGGGGGAGGSSSSGSTEPVTPTPTVPVEEENTPTVQYGTKEITISGYAKVIDDGAHLVAEDVQRLLYLGSQAVIAETLTHKDQTLFLGGLQSIGKKNYDTLQKKIDAMRTSSTPCITFQYSSGSDGDISDIPYYEDTGTYNYQSQLNLTSSQILSFKGGEKYRFALTFRRKDGTTTEAFWIGDYENTLYPVIDVSNDVIKRVVASCNITPDVIAAAKDCEFETAQLMIAEATYADRSVKAQGIINPTMFNVWDRYNDRLYGESSWISRPRNSGFASRHFEPVHNSTSSTGEIDCNYWEEDVDPTPYYRLSGSSYIDSFDGIPGGNLRKILYIITASGAHYKTSVHLFTVNLLSEGAISSLYNHEFDYDEVYEMIQNGGSDNDEYEIEAVATGEYKSTTRVESAASLYPLIKAACKSILGLDPINDVVSESTFKAWCDKVTSGTKVFCVNGTSTGYANEWTALNADDSWESVPESYTHSDINYVPAYYRKHLMFVDENLLTLNSPELQYEAVSFDNAEGYKLRIVGAAKITYTASDYTVDATPGKLPGENLIYEKFSGNTNGILSWPLWKEYGLKEKKSTEDNPINIPANYKKRTSEHYEWLEDPVIYWLHMWNHSGKINGFTDEDNSDYSRLNSKVFANLRYAYSTIFNYDIDGDPTYSIPSGSLRCYNYTSSQYIGMKIGGESHYYDANIKQSLMPPGNHKYKVLYSESVSADDEELVGNLAYLYLDTPVQIEYLSSPHAVFTLPGDKYNQTILPYLGASSSDAVTLSSNPILPWWKESSASGYYSVTQNRFSLQPSPLSDKVFPADKYLFIGEIYYDFTGNDTRYGDVKNNRFVVAGPQYTLSQLSSANIMYANQGDTYFQRWDCLKTKPAAKTDVTNGVIDITSVMLETHINIDGRTDKQREVGYIASIKTEEYGSLNPVYSQQNNYFAQRDLDGDFNQDAYGANITWTLEKHDSAEIDEWSHITLANTLKLDGDKGDCRALRRFQNSIIAFQDKGIAEILFNSRTQLSTSDGVPVELANSGKVDGKRYITNKYGCSNKWSIVEGKAALYFIDNINKAFCAFNGNVDSLSTRLNFDVWFRRDNSSKTWNPKDWENVVSYYDRIHSDVYLVTDKSGDEPCLVYNENLGAFTSFFDYARVPMMTNVGDRFISYRDGLLWKQNEGFYCNFFGEQKDFWVNYRVTPDPYGDKIWTNIDYRADFYHILDSQMADNVPEGNLINADAYGLMNDLYKENETFTSYRIWDEYQTTGDVSVNTNTSQIDPVRKKFRIWRIAIPRALKHDTNKHGLDRIRNPWVNIEFRKKMTDNRYLMQLHDIVVKYFE